MSEQGHARYRTQAEGGIKTLEIIAGLMQRDGIMRCINTFGYLLSVSKITNAEGRQQSYLGLPIRRPDISKNDIMIPPHNWSNRMDKSSRSHKTKTLFKTLVLGVL